MGVSLFEGTNLLGWFKARGSFLFFFPRILLSRKPAKTLGNGRFFKRTMAEMNEESTPRLKLNSKGHRKRHPLGLLESPLGINHQSRDQSVELESERLQGILGTAGGRGGKMGIIYQYALSVRTELCHHKDCRVTNQGPASVL